MPPRPALALVVLASPLLGAGFCGGGGFVPVPDECSTPRAEGVERLELSAGEGDFVPMADGAHLTREFGGQGAAMVPIRMRVFGRELSECISQSTSVWGPNPAYWPSEDEQWLELREPLRFYGDDRERTTDTLWLVGLGSGEKVITSTVGRAHVRRRVVVD